ncbi:MAG TPA: group II intron maturase-specific domain-containing protein [Armatimonadota bacterium]|nr:group II intron maturase-specific domain-containing protein [Armatimonadota bacterium]
MIRGWANYHRHVVSKRIFSKVDDAISTARPAPPDRPGASSRRRANPARPDGHPAPAPVLRARGRK